MSLLMQALRKAERARVQNGQEPEPAEPAPPPQDGGPAFSLMADGWRLEPLDAEPPVIPAQEAVHDPVPPQARHETQRPRAPAPDPVPPSSGSSAAPDWRDDEGRSPPLAGTSSPRATESAVRAGMRAAAPARAVASSQRRLTMLVAALLGLLLVFGLVYWRAVSGPGPGARLPMVPMPAPGAAPAVAGGLPAAAGIPVAPYATAPWPGSGEAAYSGGAPGAAGVAGAVGPAAAVGAPDFVPGATARPGIGSTSDLAAAAPATRPNVDVTVPTPEQLAAITDPAIRAEAMRDAAERAARQVRHDVAGAASGTAGVGSVPDAPPARPLPSNTAETPARSANRQAGGTEMRSRTSAAERAPGQARRPAGATGSATAKAANSGARPLPTAVGENGDVRFVRGATPDGISPAIQNGYNALKSGDLTAARQQYDLALLQDPSNRDALLGAAALALREGDGRQASGNYLRMLELDPNDPDALAGLSELRGGDLEANEVKLKGVARKHPDSGPVQFALGNLYARQGRWPEAQQSYFRAYSAMPDNADYAYNLGVGLDRMNQPRLAQTYYRRALELAQGSPPAFNVETVRKRLQALETPPQ